MKIIWSPLSLQRLEETAVHIARDKPNAAEKWIDSIFKAVGRLRKFPASGRIVPEVRRTDVREIISGNYRIIYRTEQHRISILTLKHAKQIPPEGEI